MLIIINLNKAGVIIDVTIEIVIATVRDLEVQREDDDRDQDKGIAMPIMDRHKRIANRRKHEADHVAENLETTMNKLIKRHLKY